MKTDAEQKTTANICESCSCPNDMSGSCGSDSERYSEFSFGPRGGTGDGNL